MLELSTKKRNIFKYIKILLIIWILCLNLIKKSKVTFYQLFLSTDQVFLKNKLFHILKKQ